MPGIVTPIDLPSTPAASNASDLLLKENLREKWGFDGFVVSDCGAIGDIFYNHHYAKSTEEAAADEKAVFDRYAENFDAHLQGQLQYRAPEMLAQVIGAARTDDKLLDILDLGCGTGLCGPLFKPIANSLAGVDLSPNMIEKCKARTQRVRLFAGSLASTRPSLLLRPLTVAAP